MGKGDTLLNAGIGAVASVVLAFLPFGIVLGGAVAGYLDCRPDDYRAGARVGTLTGLLALLPVLGILFTVGAFLGLGFLPLEVAGLGAVLLFVVVVLSAGYLVGGGALGGVVGAALVDEL
ncbi:DUF5518 domain-containing protein [Halosegnis marinus]|uniref:DUF5518 domain-containing protein n=2 Tax=Halosegnis marinus TaxID=3034023 RepID=A0ABD5ZRE0_9EURY|nr:DUF5518 domain-containing protein [Halosegnis sp. DT85]